ncbi:MAG TPA: winged helix-turn-helix domain-containing protein [Candidatus Bathyarchaeia archaeon]|nr:winged helix-turn-helix domain-containing protein [Candidatus Bathyarchaeia archaeon]
MMNRGRIEIMAHILSFCVQARLKTQVMYNTNITFRQFETYEILLSSQGLLAREGGRFMTTEKGHRFVHAFNQLQSTLEDVPGRIAGNGLLVSARQSTPATSVLAVR